jgi:iron complex transport system permease protein
MATIASVHARPTARTIPPIGVLFGAMVIASLASLAVGPTGVSLDALPAALRGLAADAAPADARARLILLEVRLPRTLVAMFVGASLATAGAMMQGLFRNPLADPGLIGVSAGAALAAVTVIAFGNVWMTGFTRTFGAFALPIAAMAGGLGTTFMLVTLASRSGTLAVGTLLLCGLAVSAFAFALIGLVSYASDDRELRDLTLWTLGSLSGSSWPKVLGIVPFVLLLLIVVPTLIRALNGLLLGESEAFHLGVAVERSKWLLVLATAAAVGASVAVAGLISFVGVIVPHMVRTFYGSDHRYVLPASAVGGATLLLLADIVARMLVRPAELPIGIVLAVLGAPIFLHLVLRRGASGAVGQC